VNGGNGTECARTQSAFSEYLDGAMNGRAMQLVGAHLENCEGCAEEFAAWRGMQRLLTETGPVKAPDDLGLRLRLAISHEASRRQRLRDSLTTRWQNLIQPLLLQTASGLAGAVVLFGGIAMLVGVGALPEEVLAHDEPLGAVTMPHYLYSAVSEQPVATPDDQTVVVQADVNAQGRVYDWSIISGPIDESTKAAIREQLMVQVYQPATMFGEPVRGQVLVTFSGVLVRG
jgi:anti-sigma factor RsiW